MDVPTFFACLFVLAFICVVLVSSLTRNSYVDRVRSFGTKVPLNALKEHFVTSREVI